MPRKEHATTEDPNRSWLETPHRDQIPLPAPRRRHWWDGIKGVGLGIGTYEVARIKKSGMMHRFVSSRYTECIHPRVTHEINHALPQNLSITKNNELPTITSHKINIEKQSEHHIIVIVQQHPRTKFIEQHTQINIHRLTHPRTKLRRGRRRTEGWHWPYSPSLSVRSPTTVEAGPVHPQAHGNQM